MVNPTAIDLFCGAGGFSLGMRLAGFTLSLAFDIDGSGHLQTYHANLCGEDCHHVKADLTTYGPPLPHADVVFGSPPCQGFSKGGRGRKAHLNELTPLFTALAVSATPEIILMENVENARHFREFGVACHTLRDAGYDVSWRVLDAANFGAPQHRERLFVQARRGRGRTLDSSIGLMLGESAWWPAVTHVPRERAEIWSFVVGRRLLPFVPASAVVAGDLTYLRPFRGGGKAAWTPYPADRPSRTIADLGHWHYRVDGEAMGVADGAALQGFPAGWRWEGARRGQQVGDSVPPPLARALGDKLMGAFGG